MKKAGLVKGLSQALGRPESLVALMYRSLSEAKLLSFNGARGVNGPHSTLLDGVRVAIALLCTDRPSEACQAVINFGGMTHQPAARGIFSATESPSEITFESFLVDLFKKMISSGPHLARDRFGSTSIEVLTTIPTAFVHDNSSKYGFYFSSWMKEADKEKLIEKYASEIQVSRKIYGSTILHMASEYRYYL
ncbi:hypothetical protein NKI88_16010 [Mesorhizobium sp. M0317]|uniref:hypothetical protein n=1 Tax=Mesorhizobium sp. M0317 TaxID=2956935 RepID=UPI00333831B2